MENTAVHFRLLKINHGAVRRLFKELNYYEKEENELREKVNNLKNQNKTEMEIARAEEILQETVRVVPHIKTSLQSSVKKLCEIIHEHFSPILEISDKKVQFCAKFSEENLKQILSTHYEEFCKEVEDLNNTLAKVLLHMKEDDLPTCNPLHSRDPLIPHEECVDI
ncbi:tubulin-specific chaperone a [Plasmodium gonderi]|uniref:Tubulin-specific chaperone A n=1 Tax=Plasmodium gonderi TaxID=77519 RepID=A0A1Y1JCJ7_PLAGO|nr:tubulin-specific chaperone a [Plasmodium gonderi]GAW79085.1 tubulin-specific chaperone a [Plasmodium gonderi]